MKKVIKYLRKFKGFTLIELLAVIIILALILIVAVPQIVRVVDASRTKAFHRDEDILVKACSTYLNQNAALLPESVGDIITVTYPTLVDGNYLETIMDPKSKEPCLDISKVFIKKTGAKSYQYLPALACPNYFSIAGFNLLTNYVDFNNDEDEDGLVDGFLFWSSKNDFISTLSDGVQAIEYVATKKVSLGISQIKPPTIDDKIYVSAMYKANRVIDLDAAFYFNFTAYGINVITNTSFQTFTGIFDVTNESQQIYLLDSYANEGDIIYIKDVILINLTEIYGAGNEPTVNLLDRMIENNKLY